MALYDEDILFSVKQDLQAASLTIKDATGLSELTSGTLANLFPGIVIKPVRTFDDIEALLPPFIGIGYEDHMVPRVSFYDEASTYQHVIRLIVVGTVMVAGPTGALEPNHDASVFQTRQLRNALRNYYRNDRYIPWYHVLYDAPGSFNVRGEFVFRGSPQILDIDPYHFVVVLTPEVIDQ